MIQRLQFIVSILFFYVLFLQNAIVFSATKDQKNNSKKFTPYKAYLSNLEEGAQVTVFSEAGLNWKTCTKIIDTATQKEICKEAVGWPNREANIQVLGQPLIKKIEDPFTGELVDEEYVPVEFSYLVPVKDSFEFKEGVGYIQKSLLTSKNLDSFYGQKVAPKKEPPCPPQINQKKLMKPSQSVQQLAEVTQKLAVNETAEAVYKSVGQCVVSPATKAPLPNQLPSGNLYDEMVFPQLVKQKVPPVQNEQNQPMTQADLIDIDALARTLYGEMARCYRYGLHYPIAVAQVALNRKNTPQRMSEWIDPPHNSSKPALSKIVTTSKKFNNWLSHHKGAANGPLHHSLCPPKTVNEPFYRSNRASADDVEIWKNSVKIATEAVLFPKKFQARSPEMKGIRHYTSDMGKFYDFKLVTPEVNGRSITNTRCLELWQEPSLQTKSSQAKKKK